MEGKIQPKKKMLQKTEKEYFGNGEDLRRKIQGYQINKIWQSL